MAYDAKVSQSKAVVGSIDGIVAGVIAIMVVAAMKRVITDMDTNTENALAGAIGVVVSAIIVAAKRYIDNWNKHKNDGKEPVAAEVAVEAPVAAEAPAATPAAVDPTAPTEQTPPAGN